MNQVLEKLTLPFTVNTFFFSADDTGSGELLWSAPPPFAAKAILAKGSVTKSQIQILRIEAAWDALDESTRKITAQVIDGWMKSEAMDAGENPIITSFQGVHVSWQPGRMVIVAPATKSEGMLRTILEFTYFEKELTLVEKTLQSEWPKWERDLPLAFAIDEKSLARRDELRQTFQAMLINRARIAKLYPIIHAPHIYPPTLANQLSERLRERARMTHRYESSVEQFELFERVYEMCAQRASDYTQSRTGHILEWIIIFMLGTQLVLAIFDLITRGT